MQQMSDMNVRIETRLLKKAKREASKADMSLKEYIAYLIREDTKK